MDVMGLLKAFACLISAANIVLLCGGIKLISSSFYFFHYFAQNGRPSFFSGDIRTAKRRKEILK